MVSVPVAKVWRFAIYGHFCYLWLQCVSSVTGHNKYVVPILDPHNHKFVQAIYWASQRSGKDYRDCMTGNYYITLPLQQ